VVRRAVTDGIFWRPSPTAAAKACDSSRPVTAALKRGATQNQARESRYLHDGLLTTEAHYNVLFLCTGNSARSIMAEAILNHKGKPVFTAYSAGSHPSGTVHPEALKQLELAGISTIGLRSKSWDEFSRPGAPEMQFVFTVCDNAAKEICPVWPGHPMTAHWGVPDPAAIHGDSSEIERAFRQAFFILDRRISLFLALPLASIDRLALKKEVDRIGRQ
jgi:arsenate reductase (thioredoxin)